MWVKRQKDGLLDGGTMGMGEERLGQIEEEVIWWEIDLDKEI